MPLPNEVARSLKTVNRLIQLEYDKAIQRKDCCCSEPGAFTVTHSDIAIQARFHKQIKIKKGG